MQMRARPGRPTRNKKAKQDFYAAIAMVHAVGRDSNLIFLFVIQKSYQNGILGLSTVNFLAALPKNVNISTGFNNDEGKHARELKCTHIKCNSRQARLKYVFVFLHCEGESSEFKTRSENQDFQDHKGRKRWNIDTSRRLSALHYCIAFMIFCFHLPAYFHTFSDLFAFSLLASRIHAAAREEKGRKNAGKMQIRVRMQIFNIFMFLFLFSWMTISHVERCEFHTRTRKRKQAVRVCPSSWIRMHL